MDRLKYLSLFFILASTAGLPLCAETKKETEKREVKELSEESLISYDELKKKATERDTQKRDLIDIEEITAEAEDTDN